MVPKMFFIRKIESNTCRANLNTNENGTVSVHNLCLSYFEPAALEDGKSDSLENRCGMFSHHPQPCAKKSAPNSKIFFLAIGP